MGIHCGERVTAQRFFQFRLAAGASPARRDGPKEPADRLPHRPIATLKSNRNNPRRLNWIRMVFAGRV